MSKLLQFTLVFLVSLFVYPVCGYPQQTGQANMNTTGGKLKTLEDIADKRIGIFTGTVHDGFIARHYPKATAFRYDMTSDMILSLKTNKIDAIMLDLITANILIKRNPELGILSDNVFDMPLGVGFRKDNPELRNEFNQFLKAIRENGVYDEMHRRWFIEDAESAVIPPISNPVSSKKLKAGVSVDDLPYVAYMNGEYVGFDIEMIRRFAEWAGYRLEIITVDFPALVPALASGKVSMIADGIGISEERAKQIDFSDSYAMFRTAVVAAVKNMEGPAQETAPVAKSAKSELFPANSFLQGIADSFHSNIFHEKRYLLILDGLKTTAVISVLSTLFGTLLGGIICFMRMSPKKWLRVPAAIYISALRGTPVLVVLMIIFYVVFASVDIDPIIVAVIAFGLNFAAYVSEMFRTGIEGVDRGQTEAGIAIGFTKVKTFIYIVLPQAARRILPVYKGEMVSLVKMTSIVGYIAVQDLTKASDIIRSRTFDAFFPLIMVAVLYFLISWLLMLSLEYVERRTNPKLKSRVL
jgi:polar amino acid transport system substrate-binding protein